MRSTQRSITLNEELEDYEVELAQMVHLIEINFHDLPKTLLFGTQRMILNGLMTQTCGWPLLGNLVVLLWR